MTALSKRLNEYNKIKKKHYDVPICFQVQDKSEKSL